MMTSRADVAAMHGKTPMELSTVQAWRKEMGLGERIVVLGSQSITYAFLMDAAAATLFRLTFSDSITQWVWRGEDVSTS